MKLMRIAALGGATLLAISSPTRAQTSGIVNVLDYGAACDVQEYEGMGSTTAGSTTINTGTVQLTAGKVIVLPVSGAGPFYPMQPQTGTNGFVLSGQSGTFAPGDVLDDTTDGTFTTSMQIKVDTVSSGTITGWHISRFGSYSAVVYTSMTFNKGGNTATFTPDWNGGPLATTISSVGGTSPNYTAVIGTAPGVSQAHTRVFYTGTDDYTAITNAISASASGSSEQVFIPGRCLTTQTIELPVGTSPYENPTKLVGSGGRNSILYAASTNPMAPMQYLLHRGIGTFLRGGGASDLALDCGGQVTVACIGLQGGAGMEFKDVWPWNATGAGVADFTNGDALGNKSSGVISEILWARTDPDIYSAPQFPDYNVNIQGGNDAQYTHVVADDATIANVNMNGGSTTHFKDVHTFNSIGISLPPQYGMFVHGDSLITDTQVDGATTAWVKLDSGEIVLHGLHGGCGPSTATITPSVGGVEIGNNVKVDVDNVQPNKTPCSGLSSAQIIVQDGTANADSRIGLNAQASFSQYGPVAADSIVAGAPTGGNEGTGTVNATQLYRNGTALANIATSGNASDLSGTLAVSQGGTGATTASGARTNLGAAASGTNADITSLTGLASGSASAPSVALNGNYGMFYDATDTGVGLTAAGSQVGFFGPTGYTQVIPIGTSAIVLEGNLATNVRLQRYSSDTSGSAINLGKARGSITSPAVPATGDQLGTVRYQAYTSGLFTVGAQINGKLTETGTVTSSSVGSELTFQAAKNGTNTLNELLALDPNTGDHLEADVFTGGSSPSISACGTSPSVASGSTDTAGEITTGTGSPTSCTLTFSAAKTNAPFCVVTAQTASHLTGYALATTAITLNLSGTGGDKVDYHCIQH